MEHTVQQPLPSNSPNEFAMVLNTMSRQLERLDERTRDLATRQDLEALRKELVARESLDPQLNDLRAQIQRVDKDRIADKEAADTRITALANEQISNKDRFWMRLGQISGITALALTLYEFIAHFKFVP
jgi:hypothetical protein